MDWKSKFAHLLGLSKKRKCSDIAKLPVRAIFMRQYLALSSDSHFLKVDNYPIGVQACANELGCDTRFRYVVKLDS